MPASFPQEAHARVRRMYRAQNAIWLWIAFATILSAASYVIDPSTAEQSAGGRALDGFLERTYYLSLGFGGAVVGYGIWRLDARAEIIGHLFMGAGVLITSISIIAQIGPAVSGLTLLGVAVANGFRIYYLWSVAPVRRPPDEPD